MLLLTLQPSPGVLIMCAVVCAGVCVKRGGGPQSTVQRNTLQNVS